MILGRYLGPSPDIGSHMTCNILKPNGQIFHRITLCSLIMVDLAMETHRLECQRFDTNIAIKLGPNSTAADFPPEEMTPEWEKYANDDPSSELPVTPDITLEHIAPEASENYLNRTGGMAPEVAPIIFSACSSYCNFSA